MGTKKPAPDAGAIELDLGEANPKQKLFLRPRTLYTAYGGAKGGGKTHAVRVKAAGGAQKWPGIKILVMRATLQGPRAKPHRAAPAPSAQGAVLLQRHVAPHEIHERFHDRVRPLAGRALRKRVQRHRA